MRKDRIEEKLCEIERQIKVLKAETCQSLDTLAVDMRSLQETMLEDRLSNMREGLFNGYSNMALEAVMDDSLKILQGNLLNPCPLDQREKCIGTFVGLLENSIKEFDKSGIAGMETSIKKIDRELDGNLSSLKNPPCSHCLSTFFTERQKLALTVKRVEALREKTVLLKSPLHFNKLPDEVVANLVEPLSHASRFKMLKSLAVMSLAFKELKALTGLEGGHLLYHINKLVSSGLVAKSKDDRYTITEKGIAIMNLIKKMYED